jgi:ssDNA-binding Zn-finger/Zn-ribbon topoisomerase 1
MRQANKQERRNQGRAMGCSGFPSCEGKHSRPTRAVPNMMKMQHDVSRMKAALHVRSCTVCLQCLHRRRDQAPRVTYPWWATARGRTYTP